MDETIPEFLPEKLIYLPVWNLRHFQSCQRTLLSRLVMGLVRISMILCEIHLVKVHAPYWIPGLTSLHHMDMLENDRRLPRGTEMRVNMVVILIWLMKDVVEAFL